MPASKKVDGGVDRTYFVPDEDLEKEKVALEKQGLLLHIQYCQAVFLYYRHTLLLTLCQ